MPEQLELGMNGHGMAQLNNARQARVSRAQWWFRKMREVVDLALPARERLSGRPEQTYFQLNRKIAA